MTKEFKEYVDKEKEAFVNYINGLEWNTELRTKLESLIIAYDQMKDALEEKRELILKVLKVIENNELPLHDKISGVAPKYNQHDSKVIGDCITPLLQSIKNEIKQLI